MDEKYIQSMRRWCHIIFREPLSWVVISLSFILFALPIVTIGSAWAFALTLAKEELEGNAWKAKKHIKPFLHSPLFYKSLLMGLGDIFLIVTIFLAFRTLLSPKSYIVIRFINAFFLWIDTLLLLSGLYRYAFLLESSDASLINLYGTGIAILLSNLKTTILLCMVIITITLASILIGITLFVFLPGALALLIMLFNTSDSTEKQEQKKNSF